MHRRFEFSEGTSHKFWEVWTEGKKLFTRYGRIGSDGQVTVKDAGGADKALLLAEKLVREKTGKGYRQVAGAKPGAKAAAPKPRTANARNEQLEATILADRSKEQAWLVYADWLQDQGDLRGELASLQASPKQARAAQKFLWEHRAQFFGRLAPRLAPFREEERWRAVTARWRHGFMDWLRLSAASGSSSTTQLKPGKRPAVVLFTLGHSFFDEAAKGKQLPSRWRSMPAYFYADRHHKQCTLFERVPEEKLAKKPAAACHAVLNAIDDTALSVLGIKPGQHMRTGIHFSASLDEVRTAFEADGFEVIALDDVHSSVPDVDRVDELVSALAGLDSAGLLRELVLGSAGSAGGEFDFGAAIKALVKVAPGLQALERLFIGDFTYEESEISWSSLGNATPLFAAFPKLKALTLRSGKMTLGSFAHDELEELTVISGGLPRQVLQSITAARLPKLHTLTVWTGTSSYGGSCRLADLEALLASPVLSKVRHLGLKNCQFGDEVVALLARSKVLPRLETLDVSMSHLTQAAVDTITTNATAFKKLKRLDVRQSLLPKPSERALRAVVKELEVGKQDPTWWGLAEELRYTAVGE
jgi:uncharacterized protein (TIGR02996 family)